MRIPNSRIEKAADNDNARPSLNVVQFDAEAKTLIAADGWVLVCLPVETDEEDESCQIVPSLFEFARKHDHKIVHPTASKTLVPGVGSFDNGVLEYPGTSDLIEHAEAAISEGEHVFTLDINKLIQVAEALDSYYLRFFRVENENFRNSLDICVVQPIGTRRGFGLVMSISKSATEIE